MPQHALNFLYDDGSIFAVDKPSAIHSVALRGKVNASIAALLLIHDAALKHAAQKPEDAGLINRLDFETSGVLLGARSHEAWGAFSKLLKAGEIKKSYLVLLDGELTKEKFVHGWIGSPHRSAKKVRAYAAEPRLHNRALPAESVVTPLRYDSKRNLTAARVECSSARRHQVRAHCAFIGHPLTGDTLYGSVREFAEIFPDAAARAFFLHADCAKFAHPVTGKSIVIKSPPADFCKALFK